MDEEEREQQRLECLHKAITRRDYISAMIKQLKKEYESVRIWSKKDSS